MHEIMLAMAFILGQPLPLPPGADPTPPGTVLVQESSIAAAAKLKKPMIVFVGVTEFPVVGATVLRDDFHGKNGIYVYKPDGKGWFGNGERFEANVDIEVIQAALAPKARQPLAIPFVSVRIADDDLEAAGPWPEEVEKPVGLRRYIRAKYTQEIATTNGRPRISPVSRLRLESKWHQSGGMEGVSGYRSDVYRLVASEPYQARLPVLNSFGYFQNELGWARSYPDGSRFDDVLSNTETGKVFEHRSAQKEKGKWIRRVIFKDESQRPEGYVGLSVTCSSCHDEAGTGGYGIALVPGSDTILSDPFPSLER